LIKQLETLFRYRLLIQSLVSRDLKARYRGSILGFLWSFINPLMLMLTYGLVFSVVLPGVRPKSQDPYFLFLFCGILPWTWFSSALLEASGVLIGSGTLLKKVLFPAEVLPTVNVIANFVHFLFGLPILLFFLIFFGKLSPAALLLPVPLLVQMVLTLGLALFVSALTVHFRDVQNLLGHILHLWFFSSPIIYSTEDVGPTMVQVLRLNPMTHLMKAYHDLLFSGEAVLHRGLAGTAVVAVLALWAGAFLFERLRDTLAEEV